MADDPLDRLKSMSIQPVSSFGKSGGSTGRSLISSAKVGADLGRRFNGWRLRRRLEQEGYDPITIDAAVEAVKAGRDPKPILVAGREAQKSLRRKDEMRRNPPPVHGSAHWASPSHLIAAGLLSDTPPDDGRGIVLGTVDEQHLHWTGQSHLMTVAPTRTGKGTMQIIPNLLRYRGSAVVLDPKGELAAATADWRAANVGPVYIINPFAAPACGNKTHAFNPLDHVKTEQDATKLAEMIYPRVDDDRQRFFDNEAIGFLSGVLLFTALYASPAQRTFGTIRDTVSSINRNLYGLLEAMSDPVMPNAIRNAALNVHTKTRETGLPRVIDSLSQHLRIWDTPGLRTATACSDFDFRSLKDQPATVYLVLPFEELTTYSTFVKMMFAAALDAMLANPRVPDIPVLFVLDEFLALDADDRFVSALRTHASAGVRLWFFLQDLPTLEQKYPTTWKSFLQAEVKSFFGADDPHTAELVSSYLGDHTVAYEVPNATLSVGSGASYSISDNLHLTGRRLMMPDEVIRFLAAVDPRLPRNAVQFIRGVPPIRARMTPWFTDSTLAARHSEGARDEA
ncbi:MAG: transporter [Hyphomicrobiales bacterium]|mgnify:CR=1 FL=1|nr:MAG: transporter [Hyphomicrobiales bacterium]